MSIYVGAHRAKLCRGDWRPATLYKGGQYIAGAVDSAPVTLPGAIEDTYNDYVMLTALGKGRQDSTTGKNLFDASVVTDKDLVGLSVKYLQDEDCFLINGLSTGTYSFVYDIAIENTMGKTYSLSSRYVSGEILSPETGYAVAYFGYTDTNGRHNWATAPLDNTDRTRNGVTCAFEAINSFWFYINTGFEFQNYKVKVQLEESATATPYEPYTGGMPSPNPEYPQPIAASGGTVTAEGRNLIPFPYAAKTGVINGITFEVHDNGYVTANGTASGRAMFLLTTNKYKIYAGKTYFLSGCPSGGSINTYCIQYSGDPTGVWTDSGNGATIVPSVDTAVYSFRISVGDGVTVSNLVFKPQLEMGKVCGAPYTPYRPPTQITLPTLRAIPDGSGGWAARDSMTPVPHMPGWYDVARNVKEYVVTGSESSWTFNSGINDGIKVGAYVVMTNVSIEAKDTSLCSHFRNSYPAATKNESIAEGEAFAVAGTTQLLYLSLYANRVQTNDLDGIKAWLADKYAAGTPVTVWYPLATPTTERVYLGELKSYPQYTYISADGDYLPDMTATAKFNREE